MNKIRANKSSNRTIGKVSRIAFIVACLCIVLGATVFAAGKMMGLGVHFLNKNPVDGSTAPGFSTVVEYDGQVIEEYPENGQVVQKGDTEDNLVDKLYMPVQKLEADSFSGEVLDLAAEKDGFIRMSFESFSEFEEYIGMELFNNPILDSALSGDFWRSDEQENSTEKYSCAAEILSQDGELIGVRFDGKYLVNYKEMSEEEIRAKMDEVMQRLEDDPNADNTFATRDFVQAELTVKLYTEESPILASEMFGSHIFMEGTTFSCQYYISPCKLEAAIITVYPPSGGVWYYANLGVNGAAVTLFVSHADPDYALETLKDIIDSFEN